MLDSWIISCEIVRSRDCQIIGHAKLGEIIQLLNAPARSGEMVTPNLILFGMDSGHTRRRDKSVEQFKYRSDLRDTSAHISIDA